MNYQSTDRATSVSLPPTIAPPSFQGFRDALDMNPVLAPILARLRCEPSRTWSLILTVYGDAVLPRGGSVWLGTLLALFQALDIGDGVVRTAMSRLAADGWLERRRVGRHSFYRLRSKGGTPFEAASHRIYRATPEPWQGHFELLLPEAADPVALRQAGCGAIAPGVWLALRPLAIDGLRLRTEADPATLRALAARAWPLDALGRSYGAFTDTFAPLGGFLAGGGTLAEIEAVVARVLMIHFYRRIVLRDPLLPGLVLPEHWPGGPARQLCAAIYHALLAASERWIDQNAIDETGLPLAASASVLARFRPITAQENTAAL